MPKSLLVASLLGSSSGKIKVLFAVAVATLGLSGTSQAAITVYTSLAAFNAATSAPGTDTYTGFSITGTTPSPINRSAGVYTYTAATSTTTFFGAPNLLIVSGGILEIRQVVQPIIL